MTKIFRVVVSENQEKYSGKSFIDFAPARKGSFNDATHEIILQLRRLEYPDVMNLSDGLYLFDFGNGNLQLKKEDGNSLPFDELRRKYEKDIFAQYQNMLQAGKTATVDVNNYSLASVFDFHSNAVPETPVSAREADLQEKSKYYKDLDERRRDLLQRRRERYDRQAQDELIVRRNSYQYDR